MKNNELALNPWLSMWTQPRTTIQQIIDTDPRRFVLVLAALGGVPQTLNRASMRNAGDSLGLPIILVVAIVLGPIMGILVLYLGGALVGWTGRWLGGRASFEQIRAAIAWAAVPFLWVSLLWIPELALFGEEVFTTETPRLEASPALSISLLVFAIVEIGGVLWSLVVSWKSLGQVQGFSAWKALGNFCLAGLVFIVPLMVILFVVVALAGN